MDLPLKGKNILVTGVSRPMGIGACLARTLAQRGANVAVHGFAAYDKKLGYADANTDFARELVRELTQDGYNVKCLEFSDLAQSGEPQRVVQGASECLGYIDGMVLNHAYSTSAPIGEWTDEHIMAHLRVNVCASMLMIQEFSRQLPEGVRGSVTLFTSGQYLGPMIDEIAYAVSKDATIGLCKQSAAALAPQGITVNCVNPGPTDTGYSFGSAHEAVARMFPCGRWGTPEDAARLVCFLQSDEARWITGQVIASEGGFRRDVTELPND